MRVLHKNVMLNVSDLFITQLEIFKTGEILIPEVLGTRMKRKRDSSEGGNGDEPQPTSSKRST